ncbi:hypothetical protein C2845_PM01G04470 [Panicum miliaceum]|uniref:Uncharacterized protein n=1 Tax=Panicum miliaceum TaxID=4540 RepID=A0A3L6TPX1_PANMI|nr:hypothetical protein C2845_PM01G04470 [Panicum miliaceum]
MCMQWPHGTTRYQNSSTTATRIRIIAILFRTQRCIPIPYSPIPWNHCAQATKKRRSGRAVKRRGQRIHRETKRPNPRGQSQTGRARPSSSSSVFLCLQGVRLIDSGTVHRQLQESKEQSFTQHTKNNQLPASVPSVD